MMKGLPACGKSTMAKKMIDENNGHYKRVNRDDLRMMIDNGHWSHANEDFIRQIRDTLICNGLSQGFNVIVDDTNLDPSLEAHFKQLARVYKSEFTIIDLTSIDRDLCIKRDLTRPNSVGSKVINRMYYKYIAHKETPEHIEGVPDAIMCDIDGTLSLFGDADPYERDFTKDEVNTHVADILSQYFNYDEDTMDKDGKIILCSGRQEKFREQTEQWLKDKAIFYDKLLMRQTDDTRKDSIVKKEIYDAHIRGKYNILFVLDDRDQVVQMWRSLGLTCLQVAEGDF
jgi:predicted kinase